MKHLILYFALCTSFPSLAQRGYTYRPVQEEPSLAKIFFGNIQSSTTTVRELLQVDSIHVVSHNPSDNYVVGKVNFMTSSQNRNLNFSRLNYTGYFDDNFKAKFEQLKPGDTLSMVATLYSRTAVTLKVGQSIIIE